MVVNTGAEIEGQGEEQSPVEQDFEKTVKGNKVCGLR